MNWEKILQLDAKKLHQSINFLFYLFLFYCFITISTSYRKSNEMVIPIKVKMDIPQEGTWTSSNNEIYKVTTSEYSNLELLVDTKGYPKELIFNKLLDLLYLFILGFIFWQIRGLSKSIVINKPFGSANINRLRRIGFGIMLLGCVYPVFTRLLAVLARDKVVITGLEFNPNFLLDWSYYVMGLLFFLIAHVFKKGIELREENALTI